MAFSRGYVLLVDADPDIRMAVATTLALAGRSVIAVAAGPEALKQIADHCPALVLLGSDVWRLSGTAVLARLRDVDASVPVALITQNDRPMGEMKEPQVAEYVSKPSDVVKILDVVDRSTWNCDPESAPTSPLPPHTNPSGRAETTLNGGVSPLRPS